jgi:hypothetical protein
VGLMGLLFSAVGGNAEAPVELVGIVFGNSGRDAPRVITDDR